MQVFSIALAFLLLLSVVHSAKSWKPKVGWNFPRTRITEDFPPLVDMNGGGSTTEFALGVAQAFDEATGIFQKLFKSIAFKKRIIGMDNERHIEIIKYKMS